MNKEQSEKIEEILNQKEMSMIIAGIGYDEIQRKLFIERSELEVMCEDPKLSIKLYEGNEK